MSEESIYNIIQEAAPAQQKAPMYQSLRRGKEIPPTYSTFGNHGTSVTVGNVGGYADNDVPCAHPAKKSTGSFGKNILNTVDPQCFLKMSGNRGVQPGNSTTFSRTEVVTKRSAVPKKEDKPIMGLKSDKNFIVSNAIENTLTVPKKKSPPNQIRGVDRDTFGKTPSYVTRRKNELTSEQNMRDAAAAEYLKSREAFRELSLSEVKELRSGLQLRWDNLNREFQTMGFQVETRSKKKHQEQLESELRAVETALSQVNREHIFVFADK